MRKGEIARILGRKDLDLAAQGGLGCVWLRLIAEAGVRGMTFPEIAEILFSDRHNLDECEELGFALERMANSGKGPV
jgi:hypothetical protein